jgi:hypothetical protein
MIFRYYQFNYNEEENLYTAEASSLGLKPFEVPGSFSLANRPSGLPQLRFNFSHRDFVKEGQAELEIAGWRYIDGAGNKALIIND